MATTTTRAPLPVTQSVYRRLAGRYANNNPLPASWFPARWTGPTGAAATIHYLARRNSDRLAQHLDRHYRTDPRTRDILVLASADHGPNNAGTDWYDNLITELYLDYATHHTTRRNNLVRCTFYRARARITRFEDDRIIPHDPTDHTYTRLQPITDDTADTAITNASIHELAQRIHNDCPNLWPATAAIIARELTGDIHPALPHYDRVSITRQRCRHSANQTLRVDSHV